jgi:hypothetical protein
MVAKCRLGGIPQMTTSRRYGNSEFVNKEALMRVSNFNLTVKKMLR